MSPQVVLLAKPLAAVGTRKGLLARVATQVAAQLGFVAAGQATLRTRPRRARFRSVRVRDHGRDG